ncbi:MAG: glycosyltransferase family 2 protein [Candidatus Eiseniibacteriota bacterium]|nr:MAG: glycosyltransferase family 2 protein [Candidatus Eisenbacteria bacterium]
MEISAVVPVFNEAESLKELHARLADALGSITSRYEIIFVDDGSVDDSFSVLEDIQKSDAHVRLLSFRRNFGKSAALAVGFRESTGRIVVTLDSDLQDDPKEIPFLVEKLDEGFDLVSGWKKDRKDPLTKTVPSRLFNFVVRSISGIKIHDFNCGLKVYRGDVARNLDLYGELHRFIPVLAHWSGSRVGERSVLHHPRKHGRSKFGVARFINGFLDLLSVMFLSAHESNPLHLFGRLGLFFLLVGTIINLYFAVEWLTGEPIRVRPLLLFGVGLVILAIQFISMGLLGEMIAKTGRRKEYPLKARLGFGSKERKGN